MGVQFTPQHDDQDSLDGRMISMNAQGEIFAES
jgi:hypothetical protein